MVAAMALCGVGIDHHELLQLAGRIEGHPDNAAPAIFGGMQLVIKDADGILRTMPVPLPPSLRIVVFTPDAQMKASTAVNRGVVPTSVPMADAIHNIGRTAILLTSLMTGDLSNLKHCTEERFHQNQRAKAYPHYHQCVRAALDAGAAHVFMSGAGPSVAAFAIGRDDAQCQAMAAVMKLAAAGAEVAGEARVFTVHTGKITVSSAPI